MRKLIHSAFITLDGVMEAPGLDEHRDGRNAWALRAADEGTEQANIDHLFEAGAILLGRKTYQIWAAFWPTAGADNAFTQRLNAIPKFVVSTTLKRADWNNTTVIRTDVEATIDALKQQDGPPIILHGSADLGASLRASGLVDEYRLMVFPVLLGSGKRLFPDQTALSHLRLTESRTFESGVVLLRYQPSEEPPANIYTEAYAWTEEQIQSLHAAEDTDRVLATVMFTDIVDSTGRAAALGDRPWRRLLDRHDELASAEVARWHGQLVKSTGDGILATFDAPTRALRCAFGLSASLARIGLDIRTAIHTGEVERREGDVGGIAVHIASRALAQAGEREVVVTRTVRDLATGTDLGFTPLGSVGLRGVPGQWELFSASTS